MSLRDYRFKRIGPNAMRGRGIGAARGRATIQRGKSLTPHLPFLSHISIKSKNQRANPRCVFYFFFLANARRGTTRTNQGVRR